MDKVSIIIRSKNEEKLIGQTLEALAKQNGEIPYEIIIIDSGSTDRTLDIAKAFPVSIYSIPPEKFSYGYALNYGIERASGSVICNLSAHCIPTGPDWLRSLVQPILSGQCDASYGRQVPFEGVNPWEEFHLEKLFPAGPALAERTAFSNANCAFWKTLWQELRFDEALPRWEDYLWHCLLKDRYRFDYCPEAAVRHSHPFKLKDYLKMCFKDGEARALFENQYGIVLPGEKNFRGALNMIGRDMAAHAGFFVRRGYIKELFMLPAVKPLSFQAYFSGYSERTQGRNEVPAPLAT